MKKVLSKEAADFIGGFICCLACLVMTYFFILFFG